MADYGLGAPRLGTADSLKAFFLLDVSLRVNQDRVLSPLVELVQLDRIFPLGGGGGDVVLLWLMPGSGVGGAEDWDARRYIP